MTRRRWAVPQPLRLVVIRPRPVLLPVLRQRESLLLLPVVRPQDPIPLLAGLPLARRRGVTRPGHRLPLLPVPILRSPIQVLVHLPVRLPRVANRLRRHPPPPERLRPVIRLRRALPILLLAAHPSGAHPRALIRP